MSVPPKPPAPGHVGENELAAQLAVPVETVLGWAAAGAVPHIQDRRGFWFNPQAVARALKDEDNGNAP